MAYLAPTEFVTKMIDAGESKVFMSTRDTLIRAYMAGAILALAAAFAVTINVQTGQPLAGAVLFPVGFCLLYLLGFDLLTGVFTLVPLALIDKRPGVTMGGVLRNWWLVFVGNFAGALTVAVMMAITFTFGFTEAPNLVGQESVRSAKEVRRRFEILRSKSLADLQAYLAPLKQLALCHFIGGPVCQPGAFPGSGVITVNAIHSAHRLWRTNALGLTSVVVFDADQFCLLGHCRRCSTTLEPKAVAYPVAVEALVTGDQIEE